MKNESENELETGSAIWLSILRSVIPIALAVLFAVGTSQAGVEEGKKAHKNQDYQKALKEFLQSQDNPVAQYYLGSMHDLGHGVPENITEAAKWYRKAADQGHPEAQFNLGVLYEKGIGVPKDLKEAVRLYSKAAEKNIHQAQFRLGGMHEKGEGVPKSIDKAIQYYTKAAKLGSQDAMLEIADIYLMGRRGRPIDYSVSLEWLTKASNLNNPVAHFNLGFMFATGMGVSKDIMMAHVMFELAAEKGIDDAKDNMLTAEKNMSQKEIEEAKKMAKEWRQPCGHPTGNCR